MELSLKIGSAFISKSFKLFRSQFQIISNHFKIMSKLFFNRFKFWEIKNTRNSPLWNCHSKLASRSFSCLPNYSENIFKLFSIISKSDWNFFQSFQILANWKHKKLSSMNFLLKTGFAFILKSFKCLNRFQFISEHFETILKVFSYISTFEKIGNTKNSPYETVTQNWLRVHFESLSNYAEIVLEIC